MKLPPNLVRVPSVTHPRPSIVAWTLPVLLLPSAAWADVPPGPSATTIGVSILAVVAIGGLVVLGLGLVVVGLMMGRRQARLEAAARASAAMPDPDSEEILRPEVPLPRRLPRPSPSKDAVILQKPPEPQPGADRPPLDMISPSMLDEEEDDLPTEVDPIRGPEQY